MAKQTELKKELVKKSDAELQKLISDAREVLRAERFKDKFSRKAGLIKEQKQQIARALTELNARGRDQANQS